MRYFTAILLLLLFSGCATRAIPLEPSVYLLSTNKEPDWLLEEVSKELQANNYKVESLNYNIGLLVMEPRRFVIIRGEERSFGEQSFQLRQEGGSVKLRITYKCNYPTGNMDCDANDDDAITKIKRIERLILTIINRKLFKKPGDERTKSKEI